ncbi:MAG: AAA family ATPase [Fuerstiella sp.]|nr:AAA family ATPase [Fuerstiella sp.]
MTTENTKDNRGLTATVHDVLELAKRVGPVVPVKPRSKMPLLNDWGTKASADPAQIQSWLAQYDDCNWGLLLGPKSGLIDVEDDSAEGREILEAAMEACGVKTPCYKSGKSIHRLFRFDERMETLSASVMRLFGTEWRFGHQASQSIIPPSVHPSGAPYEWLPGLSPDDVEVARLPDELWELLHELREQDDKQQAEERESKRQKRRQTKPVVPSGVAIDGSHTKHIDAAEAAVRTIPFEQLLTDEDWTCHQRDANGDQEWTRPGNDWSNQKSATLTFRDNPEGMLHVWTNAAPIPEGHYGEWRVWYLSNGYQDSDQIEAAKAFLGEDKSKEIDDAFHGTDQDSDIINGVDLRNLTFDEKEAIPFEGIDITELEQCADEQPDWIVKGIFSAHQPTLFGARSKCLKTTQLIDMSVALASGTPWLDSFEVPKRRRVLFITGESNYRAASRRLRKACLTRDKMTFGDISGMLRVEAADFPKLPRQDDCEHIKRVIDRHHPDVVIIDPLYRGLTADIDPHKMSQVGEAIVYFAQCCQPAALFISHHVIKSSARELGSPPELEDMNGAGIAESCGNWWLVGRNEKYQWDWEHDLCVQFGGRDEQGGARRIVFNEQTWTSEVENFKDYIEQRHFKLQQATDDAKATSHHQKLESARANIQRVMRNMKKPRSKKAIEDLRATVPQRTFREAFSDMVTDQTIAVRGYRDGQNRLQSEGYLLTEYADEYDQQFQSEEDAR